jgi:UDP-N-acetylglucosamine transferase subunit ALG13
MILVSVGSQTPFDRLVKAIDEWAGSRGRRDVFAQIGESSLQPSNVTWKKFIPPDEFREKVRTAGVIVAHAGMGSIITALELGKPILVMPRRAALNETRNDHQVATAQRFEAQGRIAVAYDEHELLERLDRLDELSAGERISSEASPMLVSALRTYANRGWMPRTAGAGLAERFGDLQSASGDAVGVAGKSASR